MQDILGAPMRQVWLQGLYDDNLGGTRGAVLNVDLRSCRGQGPLRNVGVGNICRLLRKLRSSSYHDCPGTTIKRVMNSLSNLGAWMSLPSHNNVMIL